MALSIHNNESTFSRFNNSNINGLSREPKFVGALPSRHQRPLFSIISNENKQSGWSDEIEHKIADAFDKKDITELVSLLCKSDESPIYVRKAINSPLYVYSNGADLDIKIKDKITLTETALYLLLKDTDIELKEIAKAFQIFSVKNAIYNPSLKLTEEFHKRLGLFENIRKTDQIINKLREARQDLGF